MATPDAVSSSQSWWGVWALALTAFIFNTTEFVPVALLGAIGDSLHMQPTDVGLMLTIYAWAVAVVSLPLTLVTRHVERRRLLVWALVAFIVSHIVTGIAWNFAVLMAGRLGIACAHAVFWSISVPLAVRLAPSDRKSRALSMLAMGTSIAMVAGIPLGRVIGEAFGWRVTFLIIAGAAGVALLLLRATLPELPSQGAGSVGSIGVFLRKPALVALYAITVLVVSAHFTSYTYIEPFVQSVNHASSSRITYVLILFGIAGMPAAICFNRVYPHRPDDFLLASIVALSGCLLILFPCALNIVTLSVHTLVWGGAIVCFGLAMQAWVLKLAPEGTDLAVSIFSGLYNVGIGAGALLGNHIAGDFGLPWVGTFGGVVGAFAVGLAWLALRLHAKRAMAEPTPTAGVQ
ncbi:MULTISPECIES: sugar transporter [Burkholderia]|uniref:DHA1 family L-arabinose/isopropyl-beta-D-thiogalactopyranoside export protein-like MFS transporter n=1 Tax=Burkholderia pyrrocinia TaxID=60550 RepID=A0A318IR08_BURPY|nr:MULTISPECIES: sugar transporter [Burkholderia]PXX37060.1 DHA1 family L-arabinose/isopropyl-beta-D-thiogalactopyranoside export protein-like MFS transporter [Burkholderia pyrrocinia]SFW49246.1 MFS transporter, DHA1 family, L-arabinose/isopropyl-beta-D-thiogalactopyranoside export protein [Burkholderia sp. NFACC33-1]SFX99926.1 MFS transporter, DHA1 family, L-arabinose/isopropyl-beta-D-thiogalactopyranoside export protein [Burkholderia sp. NFPP32]